MFCNSWISIYTKRRIVKMDKRNPNRVQSDSELIVEVRVSNTLDALYLTPRNPNMGSELVRILKNSALGIAFPKRTAYGVRVSATDAAYIFNQTEDVDFRLNEDSERFITNRQRTAAIYPHLLAELHEIKAGGLDAAKGRIEDSEGYNLLDNHQIVNVAAMTVPESLGLCIFDEQGTGKTVTFIFAFDLLVARDQVDIALIIAPKSMVPEWPRDFSHFRTDLYKVAVVAGSASQKREALHCGADVFVTNFETTISMEAD